ncbi:MAG: DUF5615 family PIN-like protein [Candidatus Bathyarchaeia archaeon]
MRIYADESVNVAIVEGLKRRGIDAFSTKDIDKLGLTDQQQIDEATEKQAAIFTHDVDFLRIAIHRKHPGIIYVHQQKYTIGECIKRLKLIAKTKTREEMRNQTIFL